MSVFLTILTVIAAIAILLLLIAALTGKDMNIERSIMIDKPVQQVFGHVRLLKNHDNFNMWMMMDPGMKKEYSGTDGQEGFVYSWDSSNHRNVGAGAQKILKIEQDKSINYELRFIRPMQDIAAAAIKTTATTDGKTLVQWSFNNKMKFPMNVMKPIMISMLSKSLDQSLANLKKFAEQ
jgi:hypothetical protein